MYELIENTEGAVVAFLEGELTEGEIYDLIDQGYISESIFEEMLDYALEEGAKEDYKAEKSDSKLAPNLRSKDVIGEAQKRLKRWKRDSHRDCTPAWKYFAKKRIDSDREQAKYWQPKGFKRLDRKIKNMGFK